MKAKIRTANALSVAVANIEDEAVTSIKALVGSRVSVSFPEQYYPRVFIGSTRYNVVQISLGGVVVLTPVDKPRKNDFDSVDIEKLLVGDLIEVLRQLQRMQKDKLLK